MPGHDSPEDVLLDYEKYRQRTADAARQAQSGSSRITAAVSKQPKEKPRPSKQKGATYRIGGELIERINGSAKEYGVQKTSFVKVLLTYALDQLDAGELELPPEEQQLRKLQV